MRITKRRAERHNLGNYEHLDIDVTVELDVDLETVDDEFIRHLDCIIDDVMAPERRQALETTCNKNAVVKELAKTRRFA